MKEKIVKQAKELFCKYGIRSVSIDDVSSALHMSKKTFYSYFNSKDDLIEQVLLSAYDKKNRMSRNSISKEKNVVDFLLENFSEFARRERDDNKSEAMLFDLQKYYPALYEAHLKRLDDYTASQMQKFIIIGQEQGLVRDDIDLEITAPLLARNLRFMITDDEQIRSFSISRKCIFVTDLFARIVLSVDGMQYYLSKINGKEKQ